MFIFSYLLFVVIHLRTAKATKYCSYEVNGDPKYFVCARNEYCCNLGCCVHLAFQFYQLWYYWLLLIFMFMMCSGGSWWYKYCRQNDTTSRYPSIPLAIERNARYNLASEFHGSRRTASSARALERTSSVNSSALDPASYHFHRIWKANNAAASPNYYSSAVVRYHPNDPDPSRRQNYECPYYQLYGPPPSYDSVVQLTETGTNSHASCLLLPATSSSSPQLDPAPPPPPSSNPPQNSAQSSSQTSPQLAHTPQGPLQALPAAAAVATKTSADAATTTTYHGGGKSRKTAADCSTSSSSSGESSPANGSPSSSPVLPLARTPSINPKSFTKYLLNSCNSNSNSRASAINQKPIPSSSAIEQSPLASVSPSSPLSAQASSLSPYSQLPKNFLPTHHHHQFQSSPTRGGGAASALGSSTAHSRRALAQMKPLLASSSPSSSKATTTTTTSTSPIQAEEDPKESGTKV